MLQPPDRRAADMVLETQRETILIEIERWLVDFQAQLRSAQLKRAALTDKCGHPVRHVIGVPDLPRARDACAAYAGLIQEVFPMTSRQAWAALRSGMPIGGDALLWIRSRPRRDRPTVTRA